MKKYLTILFAAISIAAFADTTTTKKLLPIKPIIANADGDTAFYMSYSGNFDRDTTTEIMLYVKLYGKEGNILHTFNLSVPVHVANKWKRSPTIIDDFILTKKLRIRKQ